MWQAYLYLVEKFDQILSKYREKVLDDLLPADAGYAVLNLEVEVDTLFLSDKKLFSANCILTIGSKIKSFYFAATLILSWRIDPSFSATACCPL